MSILEVWEVIYGQADEEKSKSFNWFDFEGLRKIVAEQQVNSVVFKATGLPETNPGATKNVYEEEVSLKDVATLSKEWVDERRKGY